MKAKYLVALFTVLVASLFPRVARAEWCYGLDFWCESRLDYDSGSQQLFGYSTTEDWAFDAWYVAVDNATLWDPNHELVYTDEEEAGWYSATVNFSDYAPNLEGYWEITAEHWVDVYYYEIDWWVWERLGYTEANAFAYFHPISEQSTYIGVGSGVDGMFDAQIYPSYANFSGTTVREDAVYHDTCFPMGDKRVPSVEGAMGHSPWPVGDGNWYGHDYIGWSGPDVLGWTSYYITLMDSLDAVCGFDGPQAMSMDGLGQYASHPHGLDFDASSALAYRDSASALVLVIP